MQQMRAMMHAWLRLDSWAQRQLTAYRVSWRPVPAPSHSPDTSHPPSPTSLTAPSCGVGALGGTSCGALVRGSAWETWWAVAGSPPSTPSYSPSTVPWPRSWPTLGTSPGPVCCTQPWALVQAQWRPGCTRCWGQGTRRSCGALPPPSPCTGPLPTHAARVTKGFGMALLTRHQQWALLTRHQPWAWAQRQGPGSLGPGLPPCAAYPRCLGTGAGRRFAAARVGPCPEARPWCRHRLRHPCPPPGLASPPAAAPLCAAPHPPCTPAPLERP